ncbi:ABC transporter substrate-binding protein [Erysipelothrix aquatica]|uniref:ABC transporter substrate-binding protein n=1 Tax=Erysipelothrix aquatica TaxID=2683714 RepID=UPI0013571A3F|nr:extracellular solute-binding protein [Erysipelothrix aquatica]
MRKKIISLFVVLMLITTGCSTGKKNEDKESIISVAYWGDVREDLVYQTAIEGIEDVVPNTRVELHKYESATAFWSAMVNRDESVKVPDVISLTNENHLEYIEAGFLLPLDEFNINLETSKPSAVNVWNYKGKQYGIPLTASPAVLAINRDMWDAYNLGAYPKTWNDVRSISKEVEKYGVEGLIINTEDTYHLTQYMNSFGGGWRFGSAINSEANREALTYIFTMFDEGLAMNPKDEGYTWDGAAFADGAALMTTAGTWYIGLLQDEAPDMNYDLIPMPSRTGHENGTLYSNALAIRKDSKDPQKAAQVAQYMARPLCQKEFARVIGSAPADIEENNDYYQENTHMEHLQSRSANAEPFAYPNQSTQFQKNLSDEVEAVIYAPKPTDNSARAHEILSRLERAYK